MDEDDGTDEEDALPSDPETEEDDDDDDGRRTKAPVTQGGTVLITLFTCKPYNEWALP